MFLAGNSLGGQIALETAHALPQRVDKLVLVDSAGYAFTPESIPMGFRIARVPGLRGLVEPVLPRSVVQDSLRNVYGDPSKVTPELVDRYCKLTLRAGNRQALANRFQRMLVSNGEHIKTLEAAHTDPVGWQGSPDSAGECPEVCAGYCRLTTGDL